MAIRSTRTLTISRGTTLIGILLVQNVLAQQCFNNRAYLVKRSDGAQLPLPKTTCGSNQAVQNSALNFNPQQANIQQMSFQPQSNIQQATFTQQTSSVQPQWNIQQASTQPPVNSISNSQPFQQQNQNLPSMFFTLQNNRQPAQNQNIANAQQPNSCGMKQNVEQISQHKNQGTPTLAMSVPILNQSQQSVESPQSPPTYTFQAVPNMMTHNNVPLQQNQNNISPAQNSASGQSNYYIQTHPVSSSDPSQVTTGQNPMVVVSGTQTNPVQSQPIVLTLQAPPTTPVQSQSTLMMGPMGKPIIYTVQSPNQNLNMAYKQTNRPNNIPMDDQSLMYYVISQIQNQLGNDNALASILPAVLNTKSEKSTLKTLLPLIFNILNEKRNGCECPHCGCKKNEEPIINTGYSSQKTYSAQEKAAEISTLITKKDEKPTAAPAEISKNMSKEVVEESSEASEEDVDEDYSEEYDDE